jgi:hypothetical protein
MGWPRPIPALQSRTGRRVLWLLAALVVLGGGTYVLLPLAVPALVSVIDFTLGAGVWLADQIGEGADRTTIAMAIGGEVVRLLTSPRVGAIIGGLVLLSAGALVGLQRLLELERTSGGDLDVLSKDDRKSGEGV